MPTPYIWYDPTRPFAQPAEALAAQLGFEKRLGRNFVTNGVSIKGKHILVIHTGKRAIPVELQDWSSTYWAKEHPEAFPDAPIRVKLQYNPAEGYPDGYRPYRFIGFDTLLLENALGNTPNTNTSELFWLGNLKRGGRRAWFQEHPEFDSFLWRATAPLQAAEYMRVAATFRFGLSLPGNGNLCYREIDYMALGVVPVMPRLVNTVVPELVPFRNFVPVEAFRPEMLRDERLYADISGNNREMFRKYYTREAWAAGLVELITPYL